MENDRVAVDNNNNNNDSNKGEEGVQNDVEKVVVDDSPITTTTTTIAATATAAAAMVHNNNKTVHGDDVNVAIADANVSNHQGNDLLLHNNNNNNNNNENDTTLPTTITTTIPIPMMMMIIEQMKYNIFPYTNGNFMEYNNNNTTNNNDNNNMNKNGSIRSVSTYDYLQKQWKMVTDSLIYIPQDQQEEEQQNHHHYQQQQQHHDTSLSNETTSSSVSVSYFDDWFSKLWQLHSNYTQRHYHTVVHLEEMCYYLHFILQNCTDNNTTKKKKNKNLITTQTNITTTTTTTITTTNTTKKISNLSIILLCIFFHDAIYDPQSSTNEEDSVSLFQTFIQNTNLNNTKQSQQIAAYILATKSHTIPFDTTIEEAEEEDNDTTTTPLPFPYHPLHLFLDLDMAVLGKESNAYYEYTKCIRKEYNFVPQSIYCNKRALILQEFLVNNNNTTIYHTPICSQALEQQARYNLQQEIDLLRQGIVPSVEQ